MTARTFYLCGQCLNLRSCTILKLSLLLVLALSIKREVFLRFLSLFILLRNQYVLIQIRCRMLDVESRLECAISFFLKLISTNFSKRIYFVSLANVLLKQTTTLQCLFCLLAAYFPFSYSLNRVRQAFEIAETKWINNENGNDNDNDSENGNDNQRLSNDNGYKKLWQN